LQPGHRSLPFPNGALLSLSVASTLPPFDPSSSAGFLSDIILQMAHKYPVPQ